MTKNVGVFLFPTV